MINIFDFYTIVSFLGIGQGIFLFFIIITKKNLPSLSKIFLCSLIFVFTFKISHDLLLHTSLILSFPHFTYLGSLFLYTFGPLIYLFTKYLTTKKYKISYKTFLHFIPFLAFNIYRLPKYLQSGEEKLKQLNSFYSLLGNEPEQLVVNPSFINFLKDFILWYAHPLVYIVLSITLVIKYSKSLKDFYSNTENIQLKWLRNILMFFSLIILSQFLVYIYSILSETVNLIYTPITNVFLSLLIYSITYLSLKTEPLQVIEKEQTTKKLLSDGKAESYLRIIMEKIESEKLYKDPKLTIQKLADIVEIPSRYISETINSKLNKNFYDFINEYRVKESAELLKDENFSNYKIEAIGKEAGFSSQAVFYRTFKSYYKSTPSQFRNS